MTCNTCDSNQLSAFDHHLVKRNDRNSNTRNNNPVLFMHLQHDTQIYNSTQNFSSTLFEFDQIYSKMECDFFWYQQTAKLQHNTIFYNKLFLVFSFIHMEIYFDMIYLIEYYNRGCANGRICMISMNRGDNNMNLFMKYENWLNADSKI